MVSSSLNDKKERTSSEQDNQKLQDDTNQSNGNFNLLFNINYFYILRFIKS